MRITQLKLKEIIKEEVREAINLDMLKYYDEEKEWGAGRFETSDLRYEMAKGKIKSPEELTDDHIEVAIRDAIHDDEDVADFAAARTMIPGVSNADAVQAALGNNVEEMWAVWERNNEI